MADLNLSALRYQFYNTLASYRHDVTLIISCRESITFTSVRLEFGMS